MTLNFGRLVVAIILCCGPVAAQTDTAPARSDLLPPPAPATPSAGSELLPPPAPATPSAGSDLPPPPAPATPSAGSELPAPPVDAAPVVTAQEVAALRARFEALKSRAAQDAALRKPASAETLSAIDSLTATIAANDGQRQIVAWKAQNLAILSDQLAAAAPAALPTGVPPGTAPQIALAVIAAQTTLYAQPVTDAAGVLRTVADRTTMLRVAEAGAFTLVWAPQDGFAFVLSQFREVF